MCEIGKVINEHQDSIYVYEVKNPNNIDKNSYGVHKNFDDMFL